MPAARYDSPLNLGLSQTPTGVPPELYAQFQAVYNAIHNLAQGITQLTGLASRDPAEWATISPAETLLPQNVNRLYVKASEAMLFGTVVNIYATTELLARKATATDVAKFACGYCNVPAGVAAGELTEVIIGTGLCTGISGLTAGSRYFLADAAGQVINVPPGGSSIKQCLGLAVGSGLLYFNTNFTWT